MSFSTPIDIVYWKNSNSLSFIAFFSLFLINFSVLFFFLTLISLFCLSTFPFFPPLPTSLYCSIDFQSLMQHFFRIFSYLWWSFWFPLSNLLLSLIESIYFLSKLIELVIDGFSLNPFLFGKFLLTNFLTIFFYVGSNGIFVEAITLWGILWECDLFLIRSYYEYRYLFFVDIEIVLINALFDGIEDRFVKLSGKLCIGAWIPFCFRSFCEHFFASSIYK